MVKWVNISFTLYLATSHHLNQCCIVMNKTTWNNTQEEFYKKKKFSWNLSSADTILTHWGRAMHICVTKLTIIASDNGLSPGRPQAIIWNNDGILSIGLLATNFSEILIEILTFSFKKMRLKVSSAKWRPFCLGLNVLTQWHNEALMLNWWQAITKANVDPDLCRHQCFY